MSNLFDIAPNRRRSELLNKWTTYPSDVLPMWVADMDFRCPAPILNALHNELEQGVLGYELPSRSLLQTVADRMDRLYGWSVDPESVVAVTGIVTGFNVAARTFCTGKQGYLIQPPIYNEFFTVQANLGISQYEAPLACWSDGNILHYEIDWDAFCEQVRNVRMFLLCNPHNPVGVVYSHAELLCMAEICLEHDVLIVSDEIHSELLLGGQKFIPMATLSESIADRSITFVSPSKTFNVPGLFCGFAIIPNHELRAQYTCMVDKMRIHVSSLGLLAARAALSGECDCWLDELLAYLTGNRDFLVDYVKDNLPDVRITRPSAAYLGWMDCSELVRQGRTTGSPFDFFLNKAKVAFGDGKLYSPAAANFVRINFGCTRQTLEQGLGRIRDSLYRR